MADNVLGTLFGDIANAIRSKTGEPDTAKMKPIDFPTKISGIEVGNDDDIEAIEDALDAINGEVIGETLYTVTFIGANGETLCQVPVYEEDNCDDPVSNRTIPTPTKESTETQVFTFSGWALAEGGSADKSALSKVTGDRTVYAAFTVTVRTYTVRFFDGETLLTSKQVEYGGTATYTYNATKEHYVYMGWNPEPINVTEDMNCYAVWEEAKSFADASWEYIIRASESGNAKNVFAVGDTRTEQLGSETITYRIVDFDQDDIYGSEEKAGITIVSNVLANDQKMFSSMPSSEDEAKWENSNVYYYLNNTIKPLLPPELLSGIKTVKKQQHSATNSETIDGQSEYFTGEKLWIPSPAEMGEGPYNYKPSGYCDRFFEYFATLGNREVYKQDGTPVSFWFRDGGLGGVENWTCYVMKYIADMAFYNYGTLESTTAAGVLFGFCV